ncbi:MAG: hypothetical protein HOC74_30190 [Gemmatimonadetes bacterium]|jgi:hypothetical protein|nr:hypothetical protein [Gemmatimonadota bacterium]
MNRGLGDIGSRCAWEQIDERGNSQKTKYQRNNHEGVPQILQLDQAFGKRILNMMVNQR